MSHTRKIFGALGRTLVKPVTAPAGQVAASARQVASDLRELTGRRQAQAAAIETQARALGLGDIDDAAERFETVRRARGLSDRDIEFKLRTVRRNRRIFLGYALALGGGGLAWLAWSIATQAGWIVSLGGWCLALGGLMALAQAFAHGLYQHQLEARRLDGVWTYLARRDLARHWLGW